MSAELVLILGQPESRAKARAWVSHAPDGTSLTFKAPRRTLPQNSRLHAMLTDVAAQVEWYGRKLNVEAWKDIFTASLRSAKHKLDVVPGLDGGFVMLGMHTSGMTKEELGELMELISAFGAQHGVVFSDPSRDYDAA